MADVYLICGVPGAGKTWVCERLGDKFSYIPHDDYLESESSFFTALAESSIASDKPVITECPFKERMTKQILEEKYGLNVIPMFVVDDPETIARRYTSREGKPFSQANLTKATTILSRAIEWGAFQGTSEQVLNHLKSIV